MNFSAIGYILGWLLAFFGLAMLFPAVVSFLAYGEDAGAFFESGASSVFFGVCLVLMNKGGNRHLSHKDAFLLTFCVWSSLSIIGALPIFFSGMAPTYVDALFEAVSGLTTTGASVLSGLDYGHHGVLLWRAMMQWLGGMGLIVLATAIIPFLGVGGMQLYKAEMPGVVKDKLQPRLKETAKILWGVYLVLTFVCAVAYYFAGMNPFDALCHAFTTLATGGFSTHDQSFGYFNSPLIEYIAIFFMIVGALNFSLHYLFLAGHGWKVYFKNPEVKGFFLFMFIGIMMMVVSLMLIKAMTFAEAFRQTTFNMTSVITTTGFSSVDYSAWPVLILITVMVLMFIGGCSGSTAGGMKVLRVLLIMKQGGRELQRLIHPNGVVHVKMGDQVVRSEVIQAVWSFAGLYISCFVGITIVLTLFNLDIVTAYSAAGATLTGLGPGLGDVGPSSNYADIPQGAKLVLCFSMLLGRLELFTLLVIMTPSFWKK